MNNERAAVANRCVSCGAAPGQELRDVLLSWRTCNNCRLDLGLGGGWTGNARLVLNDLITRYGSARVHRAMQAYGLL